MWSCLGFLVTNLDAEVFSTQQISDGYRLRWQIELLFKEWKSHANLRTFNTGDNSNFKGANIWISNVFGRLEWTGARRATMSHGGS